MPAHGPAVKPETSSAPSLTNKRRALSVFLICDASRLSAI